MSQLHHTRGFTRYGLIFTSLYFFFFGLALAFFSIQRLQAGPMPIAIPPDYFLQLILLDLLSHSAELFPPCLLAGILLSVIRMYRRGQAAFPPLWKKVLRLSLVWLPLQIGCSFWLVPAATVRTKTTLFTLKTGEQPDGLVAGFIQMSTEGADPVQLVSALSVNRENIRAIRRDLADSLEQNFPQEILDTVLNSSLIRPLGMSRQALHSRHTRTFYNEQHLNETLNLFLRFAAQRYQLEQDIRHQLQQRLGYLLGLPWLLLACGWLGMGIGWALRKIPLGAGVLLAVLPIMGGGYFTGLSKWMVLHHGWPWWLVYLMMPALLMGAGFIRNWGTLRQSKLNTPPASA